MATRKVRRVSDSLPCKLADEERLDFADSLAEASQAVETATNAKNSAMKQHNYEIQLAKTRRDRLANIVASKKAIVTTTINPPTVALKKFIKIAKKDDWHLFIVGDLKTPHKEYQDIALVEDCVTYLTPKDQDLISLELSEAIGWNCIQRRNFGLVAAYQWGAEIIATVDDDNIPYDHWGKNCKVNTDWSAMTYKCKQDVFDPLSPLFPALWHRGFPLELLPDRMLQKPQLVKRHVLVQADFWDGDPDIDAIARIAMQPEIEFPSSMSPIAADKLSPFNSQNTFLSRKVFPTYFLFPHIGRMDDIWAAYVTQFKFPDSVIYAKASVKQERNPHNLVNDLKAEMIGYENNLEFTKTPIGWEKFLPEKALRAYNIYKELLTDKKATPNG